MFRLVKALNSGEPVYFILCDHPHCMEARNGTVVAVNREEMHLSKKTFIRAAIEEGWWVDLEGCFCPAHAREMLHAARHAEENGKQMVAPAAPVQVLAFGRARA